MKYRKKPVVIEAVKFIRNNEHLVERFIGTILSGNMNGTGVVQELIIPTLEGEHIAKIGDYIIKGVKGEFYPCKPDVFELTYEEVK